MFKPSGYFSSSLVRRDPRSPAQETIAPQGGLIHRAYAFFTAAYIQFPPPPDSPGLPPSTLERFGMLLLAVLLLCAVVLLALPDKWSRKVLNIACCRGRK